MTETVISGVRVDEERIVPLERLVGVSEVAAILSETLGRHVERTEVSNWHARRRTTGFPAALPTRLARGLIWDKNDLEGWTGPGTRWHPGIERKDAEGAQSPDSGESVDAEG